MIAHYIKIAFRNLARQKGLAFINVTGLSVGLACFSLFLFFAVSEFSFDSFHANHANLYRVNQWWLGNKDRQPGGEASVFTPLGPAMKKDLADVQEFVRIKHAGQESFVRADEKMFRGRLSFADPAFFRVFTFPLVSGDPAQVLNHPQNLVITRDKALQLFGTVAANGKRVDIKMGEQYVPFTVTGVAENLPLNSSIRFEMMGSFSYVAASEMGRESAANWHMTIGIETYVLLKPTSRLMDEPARMAAFRKPYYADETAELIKSGSWKPGQPYPYSFRLQPIRNIHTDPTIEAGPDSAVDPKNIYILLCIAGGVLIISCINFTTLAIGRSAGRAKEVGVRKVIGSGKRQLVYQFLAESILLTIFSAGLALILAYWLLPYFNQLSGRDMRFTFSQYPQMSWMLAGLIVLVGLLAGSYPALVLSSFKPVEVLKRKVAVGGSNLFIRSLVTFQITISVGLILATLIILQQLSYIRDKNIGLNKSNVLVVDAKNTDAKKLYPLFREMLLSDARIKGITASEMALGEGAGQMGDRFQYMEQEAGAIIYPVDAEYLPVMEMKLLAGRNFNRKISSDSSRAVIINESMARELGFTPQEAIGKQLNRGSRSRSAEPVEVIGVSADFNFEPLKRAVRSQLFTMPANFTPENLFIRLQPGEPAEAIAIVNETWKKLVPALSLQYSFLDENFDRFYKAEERWSRIVGWAGSVSIFLACLGLFGLAALAAVNRTREIGIRKVLGASLTSMVTLLSKELLLLVLVALLLASPVAWYFMHQWLQDYVYRIEIGWILFFFTGLVALSIAFFTVGFHAVKTALSNPVKSLRTD